MSEPLADASMGLTPKIPATLDRTRRGALALALLFAGVAMACSSESAAPVPQGPCTMYLEDDAAFDLSLVGTGSCAATVRLTLRIATGSPDAPTWNRATDAPVAVEGVWSLGETGAVRDVTIRNSDSAALSVVGLEWAAAPGSLGFSPDRMLHNGYQSWSYTGIEPIPNTLPDERGTAPHGGDNEDLWGEIVGVSWWWTALTDAGGRALVAGADGGTVLKTFLAADGAPAPRLRIVQGITGDVVELAPGESRSLDGLFVSLGYVQERLDAYADHVAARGPSPAPRQPSLGGWGSWNLYYEDIDAAALRTEMQWVSAQLAPLGLTDLLLDDGYEPHWGAWYASVDFGTDLATLTAEQQAAGLRPAIWIAPFYVDVDDPMVSERPEWLCDQAMLV